MFQEKQPFSFISVLLLQRHIDRGSYVGTLRMKRDKFTTKDMQNLLKLWCYFYRKKCEGNDRSLYPLSIVSLKLQLYHDGSVLEQTLYLYTSKIFTHAFLLVFSPLLSRSFIEAHSNPTFPLFSLTWNKEILPASSLKVLLLINIAHFPYICLILGYYLHNRIPYSSLIHREVKEGQYITGTVSHIKPHSSYIR